MDKVLVEKKDDMAVAYLNNPDALNAMDTEMWELIGKAFDEMESDSKVRYVVITGKGDKAFSAGADIKYLSNLNKSEAESFAETVQGVCNRIENSNKIVIAAVNGYCLGGGNELAMACDIRIASKNAKFGQPEVKIGILPGAGGTQRLSRLIGVAKAKELIFSGRTIDAEEALQLGLVNKVVDHSSLIDEINNFIDSMRQSSFDAVIATKRLLNKSTVEGRYGDEKEEFTNLFETPNQIEGMKAFLEKRKAKFE